MSDKSSWSVAKWFDDDLRTATLLGFASIPVTVALNWQGDLSAVSGEALFLACVLAGYLYADRPMKSTHAGAQTALVGMLPIVIWLIIDIVSQPLSGTYQLAFVLIAGPVVIGITLLLVLLAGALCAIGGDLLHGLVSRIRTVAVRN